MVLSKSSTFKYFFQYLKFIESFYKPLLYGPRAILGGSALGHFYVTEILWPPPRVQILARQILETVLCRKKICIYVEGTTRRHFRGGVDSLRKMKTVACRLSTKMVDREQRTEDAGRISCFFTTRIFHPKVLRLRLREYANYTEFFQIR